MKKILGFVKEYWLLPFTIFAPILMVVMVVFPNRFKETWKEVLEDLEI